MKLAEWSLHFYRLPYEREITWAYASESSSDYALLKIVADNGATGIAEGIIKPTRSGFSPRSLAAVLEDVVLPSIKKTDLQDATSVAAALGKVPENTLARAMVDNACWTLRAAAAGKPLWKLWDGRPEVELSWMVTRQKPALMAAEAAEMRERHGFRVLKVKGGQGRETDLRVLFEVRAAVGPDVELYMDANGAYPREDIASYIAAIADAGATVVEDPCALAPDAQFEALQRVAPIPLLVDFACWSLADAELFLERGARALSAKPGRVGLSEARAIDRAAAKKGARITVAVNYDSALGTLVTLQQAGAIESMNPLPAEHSFYLMLTAQVSKLVPEIRGGRLQLPDEPDVSKFVDWDALKRLAL